MLCIPGTAAELPRYRYWCSEIPPTELSGDTNELCPPVTLPIAPADLQMLLSAIVADDSADRLGLLYSATVCCEEHMLPV